MKPLFKTYNNIISFIEKQDALLKKKTVLSLKKTPKNIEFLLLELGFILKKIRLKKRKTLRDFCKENNLDSVEVSNVERGLTLASSQILESYSKIV